MKERLQKVLARAGIGSRRECEKLIAGGEVTVNGQVVTELGIKVEPGEAAIKVKGRLINITPAGTQPHQYLILHKPVGVLTMVKPDQEGRPTLLDFLPRRLKTRLYPVGRLDFKSEGLVLLTNDGELAYRLTHPKFKLPKTYEVKVHGMPSPQALRMLSQGVLLEDGKTRPASVRMFKTTGKNAWLRFTIYEGRKHQIRRMCEKVRLRVSKLKRVAIGSINLKGLQRGQTRFLLPGEVKKLKQAVNLQG